ncbi:MAG: head GIN domain-containing protein [Crocinitomicaceae bacterium]
MKKLCAFFTGVLFTTIAFCGEFEKPLEHFTELKATGNLKVFLVKGEEEKIKVVNKDAELEDDRILFEVKGSELDISIKNDAFKKWDLEIYVYYKKIVTIQATKGGWVEAQDELEGDKIELSCRGDGVIKAKLACETVDCSIFTSGTMRLSGEVSIAEYKVSTGGFISGVAVEAERVVAKISTGGDISCHATQKMDLKVNMGGTIKYKFDGKKGDFKEKVSLGGEIKEIKD